MLYNDIHFQCSSKFQWNDRKWSQIIWINTLTLQMFGVYFIVVDVTVWKRIEKCKTKMSRECFGQFVVVCFIMHGTRAHKSVEIDWRKRNQRQTFLTWDTITNWYVRVGFISTHLKLINVFFSSRWLLFPRSNFTHYHKIRAISTHSQSHSSTQHEMSNVHWFHQRNRIERMNILITDLGGACVSINLDNNLESAWIRGWQRFIGVLNSLQLFNRFVRQRKERGPNIYSITLQTTKSSFLLFMCVYACCWNLCFLGSFFRSLVNYLKNFFRGAHTFQFRTNVFTGNDCHPPICFFGDLSVLYLIWFIQRR